jgi:hypothetical protein
VVQTSGGNVSVSGQPGEARIEVYIRGNNWKDQLSRTDVEERLRNYEITIDKNANTLTATARPLNSSNWKKWNWEENGLSISFRIYVPASVDTKLQTSGGNIKLNGMSSDQKVTTSGGNININASKGNIEARTSGGNIDVERFTGGLVASTSGGNVKVEEAGGTLKLTTSGGNIRLTQVRGSVEARTSGGNVTADIVSLGKYLTLGTSGGSINVKMPLDQGMDLDLAGDRVSISMQNFKGTIEDDRVKGQLNGGGIPVRIATSGGNVRVN